MDGWIRVLAWYTVAFVVFEIASTLAAIGQTVPITSFEAGLTVILLLPILILAFLAIRRSQRKP